MNNDNPKTKEEAELLSWSMQSIRDWGEIWSDMESGDRVQASFDLTKMIIELEEKGFWVFGSRTNEEYLSQV